MVLEYLFDRRNNQTQSGLFQNPVDFLSQYSTLNVGLSSGRLCRLSYSRVVEIFACPSHSCTRAISAP